MPQDAAKLAARTVLDMTPEGRGKNWYPELSYR